MKDGDIAGLGALQRNYGLVGVKSIGTSRAVVMVKTESDEPVEVASVPLREDQNVVYLRVSCDFRDRRDVASFHYSVDGQTWREIGEPLRMRYTLPHFMGESKDDVISRKGGPTEFS